MNIQDIINILLIISNFCVSIAGLVLIVLILYINDKISKIINVIDEINLNIWKIENTLEMIDNMIDDDPEDIDD